MEKQDIEYLVRKLEEERQAKRVENFSQTLAASYANGLEVDKTLLTLASAGIGVLISFLGNKEYFSILYYILFCFALIQFSICLGSTIVLLHTNKNHLQAALNGEERSPMLADTVELISKLSFLGAAVTTVSLGLYVATVFLTKGIFK